MGKTGQPQVRGDFKEYTGSASDAVTWADPNLADWVQVIGAGSVVVTTEAGNNRTITTDSGEPGAVLDGPFSALVSMTAARVRMGTGKPPALVFPASDQNLFSAKGGCVPIALTAFREVSSVGAVGNITANGGVLASDTTPVYGAVTTINDHIITWATGNVDPIGVSFALPNDFDDTADAYLDLEVSSGTTNAATIVVASSWGGGAEVSDSTSDTSTKSATAHVIQVTIDKDDIPAASSRVTFRLTPPTHATDVINLHGVRLKYKPKLLS